MLGYRKLSLWRVGLREITEIPGLPTSCSPGHATLALLVVLQGNRVQSDMVAMAQAHKMAATVQ